MLAWLYSAHAQADLDAVLERTDSPARAACAAYVALFRKALEDGNRMCLCGIMAAEYDDLPDAVKVEVAAFADLNIDWLTKALAEADAPHRAECKTMGTGDLCGGRRRPACRTQPKRHHPLRRYRCNLSGERAHSSLASPVDAASDRRSRG